MWSRASQVLLLVSLIVPVSAFATGETVNGFPTWEERVLQQLINRARVEPNTDLSGCGANCSGETSCYVAVAPLPWTYGLNRSSRFHSASMGLNAFFNHPTAFVLRTDINSVYPLTCNGAASCASTGTGSTDPYVRMSYFGVSGTGEIIAAGYGTPYDAFYGWLWENGNGTGCTFSSYNGHRYLILTGGPGLGMGYANVPGSPYTRYYTGDFGTATAAGKIVSGTHWGAAGSSAPNQRQSSSIEFWANWYDTAAPLQASVVVDNASNVMSRTRGSATNGAWTTTLGGLSTGCHRYYFQFTDSGGNAVRYPTTGTLGIGDSSCADWVGASVARSDFNGDGKSDIALQNSGSDIAEWQMNGATISAGGMVASPGGAWSIVGTGDFNGDGKSDLLLQNNATGDVAEWQMDGTSVGAGAVVSGPGTSWKVVAVGDVNGDGKSDIVLQNNSSSAIAIWLMNGFSVTSGAVASSPGAMWRVVAAADFNGDAKADLLLQNNATGDVVVWLMNGLTITSGAVVSAPGTSWRAVAAGDLNGDGKADIVLQNVSSGDIAGWLMNGLTVTSGGVIAPAAAWTLIGSADYDGDGRSDLLLRDSGGNIAEWQMNGLTVSFGAVVGTPGVAWMPIAK